MMTIREYEKIFPADCPCFDELSKFAGAGDFLSLGWQRDGGAYVQAKNYVGVIRLPSGYQIEILPKIYACEDVGNLRGLVVDMLRSLDEFAGKTFLNADLDTARLNLYEIFVRAYLEMVFDLVKRGLKASYVLREDNLNFFKGKLLVSETLRRNFAHREKFFVAFDEYGFDCPEHRLIKATLLKLLRGNVDKKKFRLANRLLAVFDSVKASTDYRKDFAATAVDKQNRAYNVVMAWTKIFLADKSFTAFAGKSDAVALLFPMERLFEAYVAHHARKNFSDRFNVKIQVAEKFLFDTPRRFALKPDILLSGDETIILDTKWKSAPAADDMYQMFAYATRYAAKKVFMLCPRSADENISYRSVDGLVVTVFHVDLRDTGASLKKLFPDGKSIIEGAADIDVEFYT